MGISFTSLRSFELLKNVRFYVFTSRIRLDDNLFDIFNMSFYYDKITWSYFSDILALPKTDIMIALNDVNNELHVRLYILEVLKDYIRDDDFDSLVDKALDFVMEGVSMPKAPAKDTTMSDISKSVLALVAGAGLDERLSKSSLELAYDRYKMRYVFDPRNRDIHGVVVGYSNDFNSLVAVCDEGSKKGVDKGSTDFVDVNERYVTNGFFYISVEDADKQSNYMGKNL